MWAHANDLRAEVADDTDICCGQDPTAWVAAIERDWRRAQLRPRERAMLEFATKLSATPGEMVEADVEALRDVGLSDTAIHDLTQVVALFNYYNRLADGLGIAIDDH